MSPRAGADPTTDVLQQFLWGWSRNGLFGQGFGIRAASPALLELPKQEWAALEAVCDFLPEAMRRAERPVEQAIARYWVPSVGFVVTRKVHMAESDGRHFVHGVVDPHGRLDPQALLGLWDWSGWCDDDAHLKASECSLPAFAVGDALASAGPAWTGSELDPRLTASLLSSFAGAVDDGVPFVLHGDLHLARRLLGVLADLLPKQFWKALGFSTFEVPRRIGRVAVSCTFDRPAEGRVFDIHSPPDVDAPRWAAAVAELAATDIVKARQLVGDSEAADLDDFALMLDLRSGSKTAVDVPARLRAYPHRLKDAVRTAGGRQAVAEWLVADPESWLQRAWPQLRTTKYSVPVAAALKAAVAHAQARDFRAADELLFVLGSTSATALLAEVHGLAPDSHGTRWTALRALHVCRAGDDEWRRWMAMPWNDVGHLLTMFPPHLRPPALMTSVREAPGDTAPDLDGLLSSAPGAVAHAVRAMSGDMAEWDRLTAFLCRGVRQGVPKQLVSGLLELQPDPDYARQRLLPALLRLLTPGELQALIPAMARAALADAPELATLFARALADATATDAEKARRGALRRKP